MNNLSLLLCFSQEYQIGYGSKALKHLNLVFAPEV